MVLHVQQKEKEMVNLMEWQKQRWHQNANAAEMMYVKVMTDEQLETLRKQIAVYATICEQLIEMHKTLSAHQDLTGRYHKNSHSQLVQLPHTRIQLVQLLCTRIQLAQLPCTRIQLARLLPFPAVSVSLVTPYKNSVFIII